MTFRVALTGGIASGKSTVAALFAELDIPVLSADLIAREVVVPGSPGLAAIVARFGRAVLTDGGVLNRAALGQQMFSNPDDKQSLERILHPRIRALMQRRSEQSGGPYQIFEIPLLVETGQAIETERVLVVDCAPGRQLDRLIARDGVGRQQAQKILAQQARREQRLAIADDVIVNDGDVNELAPRVLSLHHKYLYLAR